MFSAAKVDACTCMWYTTLVITLALCFHGTTTTATPTLKAELIVPGSSELQATDPDFATSCLWACYCYRVPQRGRSHIVVHCLNVADFPSMAPSHATVLILHNNPIRRLADDTFLLKTLRWLEVFECSACQISVIGPNAFRHLPKLKSIDLSNNTIDELSPDQFAAQKNLVLLDLTGNPSLDCDPLHRDLPKTLVLCDAVFATRPNEEFVTSLSSVDRSDTSTEAIATETASLPQLDNKVTALWAPTTALGDEVEISSVGSLWVVLGILGVIMVAAAALSIVYRQTQKARQKGMSWLADDKS